MDWLAAKMNDFKPYLLSYGFDVDLMVRSIDILVKIPGFGYRKLLTSPEKLEVGPPQPIVCLFSFFSNNLQN